jgi:DNA-binding CsgD family transcriptional regulator
MNLTEAGRINELIHLLGDYRNLKASRVGLHAFRVSLFEIMAALVRGDYAGLEERIKQLPAVGGTSRGEDAAGVCAAQMFMLHRDRGRLGQFASAIEQFGSMATQHVWGPGLMLALVEVGKPELAAREFERLAQDEFRSIPSDDIRLTSLVYCSETCVALGDAKRAALLYELLLPYAGTFATHPTAVSFGSAQLYLGMLASVSTGIGTAREHFSQAIDENNRARAWPWLARSYYQFALAMKRGGEPGDQQDARQLLREAEQIASGLGMEGLVAAIDRELRHRDTSETYPDALTAREVDVLRLLAIGRSNKDIAQVLSISLNTVATHVRNILTKTECANRTEAAAYAARNQLIETR